jgi:hypothetical protein
MQVLRKSEVDQDWPPGFVAADVGRTDIPVNHALAVQVRQCVGKRLRGLGEALETILWRARGNRFGQRLARDEVHGQIGSLGQVRSRQHAGIEHANDARMGKLTQPRELAAQTTRRHLYWQQLQGIATPL